MAVGGRHGVDQDMPWRATGRLGQDPIRTYTETKEEIFHPTGIQKYCRVLADLEEQNAKHKQDNYLYFHPI